jgi:hypothetical protein
MTEVLRAWLESHRDTWVDVEIAGRVFGGRHGESPQRPTGVQVSSDAVVITFGTTERLTVQRPTSIDIRGDSELVIQDGESATWEWHYYGRPQVPENRSRKVYTRRGGEVMVSSQGPMATPLEKWRLGRSPLVRLV